MSRSLRITPEEAATYKDNALHIAWAVGATLGQQTWVAGGLPRDLALGWRPRDLDLWIVGKHAPDAQHKLGMVLAMMHICNNPQEEYTALALNQLTGHMSFWSPLAGMKVDLCFTNGPELIDILSGFDTGICQIGYERDGTVVHTKAFENDFKHNTLTLFGQETEHFNRLRNRFGRRRKVIYSHPAVGSYSSE